MNLNSKPSCSTLFPICEQGNELIRLGQSQAAKKTLFVTNYQHERPLPIVFKHKRVLTNATGVAALSVCYQL